jgi:hypothetical protein
MEKNGVVHLIHTYMYKLKKSSLKGKLKIFTKSSTDHGFFFWKVYWKNEFSLPFPIQFKFVFNIFLGVFGMGLDSNPNPKPNET